MSSKEQRGFVDDNILDPNDTESNEEPLFLPDISPSESIELETMDQDKQLDFWLKILPVVPYEPTKEILSELSNLEKEDSLREYAFSLIDRYSKTGLFSNLKPYDLISWIDHLQAK